MSEILHSSIEDLENTAAKKGLVVVLPESNELLLDIDEPMWLFSSIGFLIHALRLNKIKCISRMNTRSAGGNIHVYLAFNRTFTTEQRIALQACCGSDAIKEALSLLRSKDWDVPVAMFETPEEKIKIEEWRASLSKVSPSRSNHYLNITDNHKSDPEELG